MGLDIRWPIGMMFSLLGAMLVVFGLVTGSKPEVYQCSLGMNVNLYWGLVLLVFGASMLTLAVRGGRKPAGGETEAPGAAKPGSRLE
jgi:hypothetical protein